MKNKKILLGLTTTEKSDWVKKVEEINEFKIEEVALFLTGIGKEDRSKLYSLLEKSCLRRIPHIHLRYVEKSEIEYLIDRYKTDLFNIHSKNEGIYEFNYPAVEEIKNNVYIENTEVIPAQEELNDFGGLCVDFSHWEYYRKSKNYLQFNKLVQDNVIGCCHISGIKNFFGLFPRAEHFAKNKRYFNYIKKYKNYLPDVISLELENDFREQLVFKRYIEEILGFKN